MFRSLNPGLQKEWIRVIQYGARLSHTSTKCNNNSPCMNKPKSHTNNYEKHLQKIFTIDSTLYSKNNTNILPWKNSTWELNFAHIKEFVNRYREEHSRRRSEKHIKEDLYCWLTGVVALSGVIVGHKWLYLDQRRHCPIPFIKSDVVQKILSESLVTKHTILAVNSNQIGQIKAIESTKEAQPPKSTLDEAASKFQTVVGECNAHMLNKFARRLSQMDQNEKAANYYGQAAEKGHVQSMYNLSSLYYEGILPDDKYRSKGLLYMKMAADEGLLKAQSFIALRYAENQQWDDAVRYFKIAAEKQDLTSIFNLAVCYENGFGVAQDVGKAINLYLSGAKKGHFMSQFCIGESYEKGVRGMRKDLKEAMKWYKRAAEQGHTKSSNRAELLQYELDQRNEDYLLTLLESNTLLKLLKPARVVQYDFHKSSSMPSLQSLRDESDTNLMGGMNISHGSTLGMNNHIHGVKSIDIIKTSFAGRNTWRLGDNFVSNVGDATKLSSIL
ncbi:uncharacterized protein LOC130655104 isoform X2 [Hydractinia symbiolongicarpus]|uniref:uncharacterized protein LOC130655104 isoform X2 n=1 Tax=Hydractinia symbiolongicarpus TaxID=13093 RepID=UPI002549D994|nr:uncharacterized protein LOC130655104 isoform X2 [Hydractinia symbiolongicarpus]